MFDLSGLRPAPVTSGLSAGGDAPQERQRVSGDKHEEAIMDMIMA